MISCEQTSDIANRILGYNKDTTSVLARLRFLQGQKLTLISKPKETKSNRNEKRANVCTKLLTIKRRLKMAEKVNQVTAYVSDETKRRIDRLTIVMDQGKSAILKLAIIKGLDQLESFMEEGLKRLEERQERGRKKMQNSARKIAEARLKKLQGKGGDIK